MYLGYAQYKLAKWLACGHSWEGPTIGDMLAACHLPGFRYLTSTFRSLVSIGCVQELWPLLATGSIRAYVTWGSSVLALVTASRHR